MSDITVNNFKAFYEQIRPYLGAVHSGFTPIGTVISVMGTNAPLNYLACDGTVYNIADYPELAAYFNQQFGASNHFGGNGTTTFAVPDLRGEFLRGTGTNSHANQGSGANVGEHQDGTATPLVQASNTHTQLALRASTGVEWTRVDNADTNISGTTVQVYQPASKTAQVTDTIKTTSRPTNTSVLYCIASKNIFMDAGSNYSTEEQVVGTWMGKPLYQKVITFTTPNNNTENILDIDTTDNISNARIVFGYISETGNNPNWSLPIITYDLSNIQIALNGKKVYVCVKNNRYQNKTCYLVVQYTKTTD